MLPERQQPYEFFRMILVTVVGQAFTAANYELEQKPIQWGSGKFRFIKPLDATFKAYIDFQVLAYTDNSHVARMPSRFRVMLIRSDQPGGAPSDHPWYARRLLSELVVEDFGVSILPSADHWWTYTHTESLGKALAEAGHLIVGYALPWLTGDLVPDDEA